MWIPAPAPFGSFDTLFDYAAQSIVIIGGGPAVGKFAISWLKYAGFGTIVATASLSGAEEVKSLGATHVVDRKLPDAGVITQVRAIVGDDLIYAFDVVNFAARITLGVHLLSNSKRGAITSVAGGSVDPAAPQFANKRAGFSVQRLLGFPWTEPDLGMVYWEHVVSLIEKGVVKPTKYSVIKGLDADAVNKALDDYNAGKAVVKPQLQFA